MADSESTRPEQTADAAGSGDQAESLRTAAEAVRLAEAELQRVREGCERLRSQVAERLEAIRKKTVGDVIDDVLAAVRKHPGRGVLLSLLAGFLAGRLFRK